MTELYPMPGFVDPLVGNPSARALPDSVTAELRYEPKIEFMHKILRGELSAVAAYGSVIEKYPASPYVGQLRVIQNHHRASVDALRQLLDSNGEIADRDSGVWGTFVQTLIAGSNTLSLEISLKTLIEGEEHGLKQYQELIEFPLTDRELNLIESSLIPRQFAHIQSLKSIV